MSPKTGKTKASETGKVSRKRRRENDEQQQRNDRAKKSHAAKADENPLSPLLTAAASLHDASDPDQKHQEETQQNQTTAMQQHPAHAGNESPNTNSENDGNILALVKLSSLLSVPLEFVFREIPASSAPSSASSVVRHKPLLSRNEAQCFLNIATLATEFDELSSLSSRILQEKIELGSFTSCLYEPNKRKLPSCFGSLYALGKVLENDLTQEALNRVTESFDEIFGKMENIVVQLKQSSEQNWAIYESLQDVDDGVENSVSADKRHLAEVQEELARRIESLFAMMEDEEEEEDNNDSSSARSTGNLLNKCSMADFCTGLFGEKTAAAATTVAPAVATTPVTTTATLAPTNNAGNTTPPARASSQRSRVSTGSKPSPTGSETEGSTVAAEEVHHFPLNTQEDERRDSDHDIGHQSQALGGFRSRSSSPDRPDSPAIENRTLDDCTTNTQIGADALLSFGTSET